MKNVVVAIALLLLMSQESFLVRHRFLHSRCRLCFGWYLLVAVEWFGGKKSWVWDGVRDAQHSCH
jgi:predicted small integral membrane protein